MENEGSMEQDNSEYVPHNDDKEIENSGIIDMLENNNTENEVQEVNNTDAVNEMSETDSSDMENEELGPRPRQPSIRLKDYYCYSVINESSHKHSDPTCSSVNHILTVWLRANIPNFNVYVTECIQSHALALVWFGGGTVKRASQRVIAVEIEKLGNQTSTLTRFLAAILKNSTPFQTYLCCVWNSGGQPPNTRPD
ncbi:hypothetical protein MTR_3g116705 [Medicago truncatula]|uniref:Uncharacterized protein n=1 Tax=Medicago truncatula TaxID=3880 RepID=A0A072V4X4_MEDTR|nr:hypothetical protein MTR_3g116705 [Medicago truncatula]